VETESLELRPSPSDPSAETELLKELNSAILEPPTELMDLAALPPALSLQPPLSAETLLDFATLSSTALELLPRAQLTLSSPTEHHAENSSECAMCLSRSLALEPHQAVLDPQPSQDSQRSMPAGLTTT